MGGRNAAWQPSRLRGQSSGAVSAATLTGLWAAAQTGLPLRPLVRESVVAWKPRRHGLGGVRHGGAVNDGGVGHVARSTERPCRSRPWAQPRGADGAQVRDGTDACAHGHGTAARCPWPQIHGGEGDAGRGSARRAGVSRRGLRPQEAGAPRWRYRLSRRVDESADCGTASPRAPAPAGAPAVAGSRPRPAWKGSRAPWYAYAQTIGSGASGPGGIGGARPAWCRMLTTAPARGASRPHAWRGRGHYAVAYSSPRRVSGSPHAVAAQRSASPDGACAGVAPGAMRWAHQPLARVLEAPALGVHGRMRCHTVAPGKTGTGRPSR